MCKSSLILIVIVFSAIFKTSFQYYYTVIMQ
nr:MAG TPA: hypothetical protein [Bacteriophage sp.]